MNILIVGNGFDLSHYLPTKYDHFMVAMDAIENWDINKGEMSFDDLFQKDYWYKNIETGEEEQNKFFQHTKAMYKTEEIKISVDEGQKLQNQLKENVWYQYFSEHVREVKTWIDFEQKIEEVLINLGEIIKDFSKVKSSTEILNYLNFSSTEIWSIKEKSFKIFDFFGLWESEKYVSVAIGSAKVYSDRANLNPKFCYGNNVENGFDPSLFIDFLQKELDEFIEIFNLYLKLVIDKLEPKAQFKIEAESWVKPDHIFSFNYTNTFQKFYTSTNTEFLHGRFGEKQNIVLGISDLEDEGLKKLKAYGFTKYHQKLFKDTDYLFLDECSQVKKRILGLSPSAMGKGTKFIIWGHSLDKSDQEYIQEIFKLNDKQYIGVKVIVYYFDDNSKFMLLNNLLAILGKDKVEKWMKNKWLVFKENPKVKFAENISEQTV